MVSRRAAETVMAVVLSAGAVALLPVLAAGNAADLMGLRGGLVALWLGLFATAAAYLFLAKGLASIPVTHAGTLALGEPMVAALLGIFLLKEPLTALAWVGVMLIFSALALISSGGRPASRADDSTG
jgi:DME family drug/metabolite transporter